MLRLSGYEILCTVYDLGTARFYVALFLACLLEFSVRPTRIRVLAKDIFHEIMY